MKFRLLAIVRVAALVVVVCTGTAGRLVAQADSSAAARARITHILRTRDGSTFLGRLVSQDSTQVIFETSVGLLTIPRAKVAELTAIRNEDIRDGEYWYPDPNRSRLLLGPTGRTLRQGEGYYQNTYLLLQNFYVGATDRLSFGAGFTLIPNVTPDNWGYYLMPKLGVYESEKVNVAVGAFLFAAGSSVDVKPLDVLYGVGTFGKPDGSISAGVGLQSQSGSFSNPMMMLGGERRVSRRFGLISENYGLWKNETRQTCQPATAFNCSLTSYRSFVAVASYGARFIGEKIAVDFAFWNLSGDGNDWIIPGVPYVSFSVRF